MDFGKIAILTTQRSAFDPFSSKLEKKLIEKEYLTKVFYNHKEISSEYDVVFILSYERIITQEYLSRHKHNIVVHGSDLPKGKGWSPIFWQILEGKNRIPIVLFEAIPDLDAGKIYFKDYINFEGHEINEEIRRAQSEKCIEMCLKFLDKYNYLEPCSQEGESTFYKKRTPKDSEIDIRKTILDNFNLLRIVNNDQYPAFFYHSGHKYILKIYKEDKEEIDGNL